MHVQPTADIYNSNSKIQRNAKMLREAMSSRCRAHSYLCSNLRGYLHIIGKWDKLQELSRVPTCHTNMNAVRMSYSYHFKILFFLSFQKVHYYASEFILFLPVLHFMKNSFLFFGFHLHTQIGRAHV